MSPGPALSRTPAGPAEAQDAERAARDARLAGWIARAAAGDARAFAEFHDGTAGYAQALARRMLSEADLEDVLADAYLQAWQQAGRYEPSRGSPVSWLLAIVRSRALDHLRRRRHEKHQDDDCGLDEQPSDVPGPQELLAATEGTSALHAALSALSAQERWLLGLAYYRELTHSQISGCTGLPLGTVKSSLLRAQAKLREALT